MEEKINLKLLLFFGSWIERYLIYFFFGMNLMDDIGPHGGKNQFEVTFIFWIIVLKNIYDDFQN